MTVSHIARLGGGALLLLIALWGVAPAQAQYYVDQNEMADILGPCGPDLENLPEVYYEYYVLDDPRGNDIRARTTYYKIIGEGDTRVGQERAKVVDVLNRTKIQMLSIGDTLVVPRTFADDFCAYSPFPRFYTGARDYDKLFIIDKSIQAWAAYEHGRLVRWGVVNTGAEGSRTPNGRFNFNWKQEYRVSTLSPKDEPWEMYWVFNFHQERGIHVHQYAFPTGGPTSHGCVRLIDADAQWIYHWAEGWQTRGSSGPGTYYSDVVKPGTTVLVIGDDPTGNPRPFTFRRRYPTLVQIDLPAHPMDVPPGTALQERFDKRLSTR